MMGDASQEAEHLQNTLITEEKIEQNFCKQPQYIRIPFSDMSEENPEKGEIVSTNTPYKLINGYPSENEIRKRKSYVMSYNNVTNNADWVYEIFNASTLADNCEKELKLGDTNYHKGHLAAAANHKWCLEALNDASLFSNKAPQQKNLNQSTCKKLENNCREIAKYETVRNLHVYTGPLYPEELTMKGVKALPSHFFKVIIVEDHNGTVIQPFCFLVPNEQPTSDNCYVNQCSIEHIEHHSGLIFICTPLGVTQDRIKTIKWQGKNEAGEICYADIKVRISS
ncbi:endonuclease G, mitochondrial-like [Triplophysa dalaica]|uniref:endonuclease G, mitochondrial-like n=1 Tax=Triplophysa dalaica TaxID=1582913 RepID=UPI0024DF6934|nr:endonuclease G, mitochondrial-like [Triplophysa dalaica]